MTQYRIPGNFRIGHIHLKVANLERAIAFYDDVLGFDLNFNLGDFAFLSAGGYRHQIGLNTWESKGVNPPVQNTSGLYHFALNYPERTTRNHRHTSKFHAGQKQKNPELGVRKCETSCFNLSSTAKASARQLHQASARSLRVSLAPAEDFRQWPVQAIPKCP
jgi:catechol-2,3-dioxygenase